MTTTATAQIRTLSRGECETILMRNSVGRLAYARENQIDIQPIHYVYADGWIYGRTSEGRKMEMIGDQWWPVAFEVDEVEELFKWRSVVVHGGMYPLQPTSWMPEPSAYETALQHVRSLVPNTLRPGDPAPHRTVIFRIAAQVISGREAVQH